MKRLIKKISVITLAAVFVGAGISGMAIAANKEAQNAEREMALLPPMIEKMTDKLELTDAQKSQLEALKERQQALRTEFWEVFTEEQKTTMLQAMMKHRKGRGDGKHFNKGPRGEKRQRGEATDSPR